MDEFLDISKINKLQPEKGRILISEPFMMDSNFKRSVIFLCEHNEDGTFGFVVNNDLDINLTDLVEGIENTEFKVSFGGPVNSNNLYYLHTLNELIEDCHQVNSELYTGGDFDQIKNLINSGIITTNDIRFFLGYSGWEPGQLDSEIQLNSWLVGEITSKEILSNPTKKLWNNTLEKMGGKFKILSNFPEDPSLN